MDLFNKPKLPSPNEALKALEVEWGEPVLYCVTGQFLTADGLGKVPLQSWGLVALTPTRILFRHYAQSHQLFGLKDPEVNWSVARSQFTTCKPQIQPFWSRLFSPTPDHVALEGTSTKLLIELTDDVRKLPSVWATP